MSVKGRIAQFYSSKSNRVDLLWILAQIASCLFVISSICALFIAPGNTALGVGMKIYDVFVVGLIVFVFVYKIVQKNSINTNELYTGYYIGLCMMTCMNLIIISVIYGSESNLVEIVGGSHGGIVVFRLVASFAIFILFFYILYVYFYIRYYSDILSEHRSFLLSQSSVGGKKQLNAVEPKVEPASHQTQDMVLVKKMPNPPPNPATPAPSNAMVLANRPGAAAPSTANAMVLSKPAATQSPHTPNAIVLSSAAPRSETSNPGSGLMAPPGLK